VRNQDIFYLNWADLKKHSFNDASSTGRKGGLVHKLLKLR